MEYYGWKKHLGAGRNGLDYNINKLRKASPARTIIYVYKTQILS